MSGHGFLESVVKIVLEGGSAFGRSKDPSVNLVDFVFGGFGEEFDLSGVDGEADMGHSSAYPWKREKAGATRGREEHRQGCLCQNSKRNPGTGLKTGHYKGKSKPEIRKS
jgi:hypothetical protein